jgi:hypothetical protein
MRPKLRRNEATGAGLGEIGFSYRALGARLGTIGFVSGQMSAGLSAIVATAMEGHGHDG